MGYNPTQMYDHIKNNFLLARDITRKVTKTKEDFKVAYKPNEIVQTYYNKIKMVVDTSITLNHSVTNSNTMIARKHVWSGTDYVYKIKIGIK